MKLHHKTPISLVFGTLINIVLIVLFEILVLYRTPLPPSAEVLAKMDSRYENCQVMADVNMDTNRGVRFYRIMTASGETDLIPLKQHSFFPSRAKISTRKILRNLDLDTEDTKQVLFGPEVYTVFLSGGRIHTMFSAGGSFQQLALSKYLGLGLVLAFFELLLLEKLRGD